MNQDEKVNIADMSLKGDLFWAVSNMINIEEHLSASYMKTKNEAFLQIYDELRKIRAKHLRKLVETLEDGSEHWCYSKHLCSTVMRFTEVGIKAKKMGNEEEAKDYFETANELFRLFWFMQEFAKQTKENQLEQKKDYIVSEKVV